MAQNSDFRRRNLLKNCISLLKKLAPRKNQVFEHQVRISELNLGDHPIWYGTLCIWSEVPSRVKSKIRPRMALNMQSLVQKCGKKNFCPFMYCSYSEIKDGSLQRNNRHLTSISAKNGFYVSRDKRIFLGWNFKSISTAHHAWEEDRYHSIYTTFFRSELLNNGLNSSWNCEMWCYSNTIYQGLLFHKDHKPFLY